MADKFRASFFGILSVALPLIGLSMCALAALARLAPDNHPTILLFVVIGYAAACLFGTGFGIIGMIIGERMRWLPAIGFGFNLVLIALAFIM